MTKYFLHDLRVYFWITLILMETLIIHFLVWQASMMSLSTQALRDSRGWVMCGAVSDVQGFSAHCLSILLSFLPQNMCDSKASPEHSSNAPYHSFCILTSHLISISNHMFCHTHIFLLNEIFVYQSLYKIMSFAFFGSKVMVGLTTSWVLGLQTITNKSIFFIP